MAVFVKVILDSMVLSYYKLWNGAWCKVVFKMGNHSVYSDTAQVRVFAVML